MKRASDTHSVPPTPHRSSPNPPSPQERLCATCKRAIVWNAGYGYWVHRGAFWRWLLHHRVEELKV